MDFNFGDTSNGLKPFWVEAVICSRHFPLRLTKAGAETVQNDHFDDFWVHHLWTRGEGGGSAGGGGGAGRAM